MLFRLKHFLDLSRPSSERYYFETKAYVYCVEQQRRLVWTLELKYVLTKHDLDKTFIWQSIPWYCGVSRAF